MNNDTRWNSTYLMISRAFLKQGGIGASLVHPEVEKWVLEADMLKGNDWRLLAETKHIIEPFYLQTMTTQGWAAEEVELGQWRPDRNRQTPARFRDCKMDIHPRKPMQSSLPGRGSGQCDDGSGKPSGPSAVDDMGKDHRRYLRLSIISTWQQLNEYYTNLGESPLFAASTILHPSLGKSYLEVNRALEE
ncbi:hypothetical protein FOCG_18393 [Fusarium oxysporum f. sp. radicis-lycopersici 26381]|nr:hypothetical protein FOCG_18393 [Fusarium oxysporum f. sp. radicis-lycopersici 26381]